MKLSWVRTKINRELIDIPWEVYKCIEEYVGRLGSSELLEFRELN